jgi:hypothetical protein
LLSTVVVVSIVVVVVVVVVAHRCHRPCRRLRRGRFLCRRRHHRRHRSFEPANVFGSGDPLTNFFPKGVKEYEEFFQKLSQEFCDGICDNLDLACVQSCLQNAAAEGEAVASVALYCSCYQGYELGCSNKLPSTPQEKDEYCKFAGVWNGDFNSKEVKLSRETNDCGCFWISQVTDEVGNCPGVDLGYGYFERRF